MSRDRTVERLKAELAQGRVVVVTGTGVSIALSDNQHVDGHPVATWTGLLAHGTEYCQHIGALDPNDAAIVRTLIASGKCDFLISQCLKSRSDGVFRGWLQDTLGSLTVRAPTLGRTLSDFPGVLATLNYDGLLEQVTARRPVTWLEADRVQSVLRRELENAILHLHGYHEQPESVVLGTRAYIAVKEHPHAATVLRLLTLDRTLLFIGCGDTLLDPNFGKLLEWSLGACRRFAPPCVSVPYGGPRDRAQATGRRPLDTRPGLWRKVR